MGKEKQYVLIFMFSESDMKTLFYGHHAVFMNGNHLTKYFLHTQGNRNALDSPKLEVIVLQMLMCTNFLAKQTKIICTHEHL